MNFYKHHIGDYAQATAHLSFVEDAAYSRMLRKYYAEEKPLPADLKAVQRLVGARTRDEKEAVALVLEEFFTLADDGWHNKRADAELGRANAQAEANRRVAVEREAKKRVKEEQARRANESTTIRAGSEHESLVVQGHESLPSREPSQTPDARHQTPDLNTGVHQRADLDAAAGAQPGPGQVQPTPRGLIGLTLKRAGIDMTRVSLPDVRLEALLAQGATLDEVEEVAREAVDKGIRKPLGWIVAAIAGRRQDAAAVTLPPATGPTTGARRSATDRQVATLNALTGTDQSHGRPDPTNDPADVVDVEARDVR